MFSDWKDSKEMSLNMWETFQLTEFDSFLILKKVKVTAIKILLQVSKETNGSWVQLRNFADTMRYWRKSYV